MNDTDAIGRLRLYAFHLGELVRCTTPRRFWNLLGLRIQRFLRRDKVAGMPGFYFIDPINICNLRCPLCPTGRGVLARPQGRMPLPLFRKILDEIAPYAYRIELYNWGEPLLHPQIIPMIEYARKHRISVRLSSNLNFLPADLAPQLVESGLNQLIVSIDGTTQKSYEAYRRRGDLGRVLTNLRLVLEARRQVGTASPFIVWRMLVGKHNEHEVQAVRKMAQEMGVDSFSTGVLFIDTQDAQQVEQWLPTNPAYSCYDYSSSVLKNTWACRELWDGMVINWDGGVAPCCWLHDVQHDFGNITVQTVREVWNGPIYRSARRAISGARRRSTDVPTICHRCRGHPHYMAY